MSDEAAKTTEAASRLGLRPGDIVGEMGYDDDADETLRAGIEAVTGSELLDGDSDEMFDAVLVWWREGDGDLTDELVDAVTALADDGVILLATPRSGRDGYVDAGEIADAVPTAGLGQTMSGPAVGDWMTTKIMRARSSNKSRR